MFADMLILWNYKGATNYNYTWKKQIKITTLSHIYFEPGGLKVSL